MRDFFRLGGGENIPALCAGIGLDEVGGGLLLRLATSVLTLLSNQVRAAPLEFELGRELILRNLLLPLDCEGATLV